MRTNIFVFFILLSLKINAQQKENDVFSVGLNPLSLGESAMTLGPCISYHFNERFELWVEGSYIIRNNYLPPRWKDVNGFRFIIQPRYFMGAEKTFFVAPEFRVKKINFDNTLYLTNLTNGTFLNNTTIKQEQRVTSIAAIAGGQFLMFEKSNIHFELTFGLGYRFRKIIRKNIPTGYEYVYYDRKDQRNCVGFGPTPLKFYEKNNSSMVYVPIGIRFMWTLK